MELHRIPSWDKFLTEGALSNFRAAKEGKKLTFEDDFQYKFDQILYKLIDEKIPFWFDCIYKDGDKTYSRIGYLMNDSINGQPFGGYILKQNENPKLIEKNLFDKILPNVVIEKPGKLNIGRSTYADITKSDLETIAIVVKALKSYYKDKRLSGREIAGNRYEARINIDFLCDTKNVNDVIDYVF